MRLIPFARSFALPFVASLVLNPTEPAAAQESVDPPYVVVPAPAEDAGLFAMLDGQDQGIWLDGDVLWLATVHPDGPWRVIGGVSEPLTQLKDSDVWAVGLQWNRWPETFMRVAFLGDSPKQSPLEYHPWRGAQAPAPPAEAEPDNVVSFTLAGPTSEQQRTVTVVLPPGHEDAGLLPTIVLADGQSAEAWGKVIASLVLEGRARPVAIVGVHSGSYKGDRSKPYDPQLDTRAREYLQGYDEERFEAHLDWVIEDVLPEAARRYPLSLDREDLAVAGFSNGGAFAAAAALERPHVFAMSLALSVGVPPEIEGQEPDAPMPRFFFAAGELEQNFLHHTRLTHDLVTAAGAEATMTSYPAGHDRAMWLLAMARYVPLMFPPEQATADTP